MDKDAGPARVEAPSTPHSDGSAPQVRPAACGFDAVMEIGVGAREIDVALPGQGIEDDLAQADRVNYLDRVPKPARVAHHGHCVGVAQVRMDILKAYLPPDIGRRLGPLEQALASAAVSGGLAHQANTVGIEKLLVHDSH